MNFRTASKELLTVARQYKEDLDTARDYFVESNIRGRLESNGIMIDPRDFLPMIILMGIKGDTKAERTKDIHKKLEELTEAFSDPDLKRREEYLAMLYYMVDDFPNDFDPVTMNMNDPAKVAKLLQGMLISQTIETQKFENSDFFNKRYPTPEMRNLEHAHEHFMVAISSIVNTILETNDIHMDSAPEELEKDGVESNDLEEDDQKDLLEEVKKTNGALIKFDTVDFPILDAMIPYIGKDARDIRNIPPNQFYLVKNYYTFLVESTTLLDDSQNTLSLMDASMEKVKEAVYIDGKPYSEFEKEYLNDGGTGGIEDIIICVSMLGGEHKVDIVQAYPDEAGEIQYSAKTMRFTVTPEQEKRYMQQFSWVHRNLFNWWPFRIESLQEKIDRITNDPEADARHDSVIQMHKRKIEDGLAKKDDNLQQRRKVSEGEAQKKATFKEANDRLIATVTQWDGKSVIGILGQQITATYDFGETKSEGAYNAIRSILLTDGPEGKYDKMSPLFAKVLLYTQLCGEREANGGQPGELEQALGAGRSVRDNIEKTAAQMAEDPIFKNLVLEKIGDKHNGVLAPDCQKYEKLLVNGGCAPFLLEYKLKMKEAGNRKEQQPLANETQLVNQQQQKMQKGPM